MVKPLKPLFFSEKPLKTFILDNKPLFSGKAVFQHEVNSESVMLSKVSYIIGHGLGPYFLQKTVDDILSTPGTYFTLHFDETTTSQIKKQLDILVRYYSDNHNEVRVRFLKAAVFGHAYAESVANELCETLQKFSLPLKYLLSLPSDGPNVNKAIKTNINRRLQVNYQRELVDTGPCQLHVVHNSFRKGVEGYSSDVENLCIDIYYFFKL